EPPLAPEPSAPAMQAAPHAVEAAPPTPPAAPAADQPWPGSQEETSVMPAWQPEATQAMTPITAPEPPAGVDDTLIMGGPAAAGAGAGAGAAEAPSAAGGAELRIQ